MLFANLRLPHLLDCCRKRMGDRLRGHGETIGERLERDLAGGWNGFQLALKSMRA
jgi:hypothetical protein